MAEDLALLGPDAVLQSFYGTKQIRRAGCWKREGRTWGLPKSFADYRTADPRLSVRGAAPKIIVQCLSDRQEWYMVKGAEMFGETETYTELLINQLGERLGFRMAHSGLVRVDGELRFCSRNFLPDGEDMRHGSVLIESFFDYDLEKVGKNPWNEQRTYDIDTIRDLLHHTCGDDFDAVFADFIEMLVFDALTGSMDRHMQNWGLLVRTVLPVRYRFAPIFDSARALLWNYNEGKLENLAKSDHQIRGYTQRAKPKVGCAEVGKSINHFELVRHLALKYPNETARALSKVTVENVGVASNVVREYPFKRAFSPLRRDMVARVLAIRAEQLAQSATEKGGAK